MTYCDAYVIDVTKDGLVWVELPARLATCENCPNPIVCQSGLNARAQRVRRYVLPNTLNLQVGDQVKLIVPDGVIFRAALFSYLIPLILLIFGALLGQWLDDDRGAAIGVVLGLMLGYGCLKNQSHQTTRIKLSPLSLQRSAPMNEPFFNEQP